MPKQKTKQTENMIEREREVSRSVLRKSIHFIMNVYHQPNSEGQTHYAVLK